MPSPESERVVYLIGPIRTTRPKKVRGWRDHAKRRLEEMGFRCLDLADRSERVRDQWAPQEIGYVRNCDLVLANMWKPSIGTTLGIVRARQAGRPVVLRVSRHIKSPMLAALVGSRNVVTTMTDAYEQVASVGEQLDRITIKEDDGPPSPVRTRDLARLVSKAASDAEEEDFGLEAIVVNELMTQLAPSNSGTDVCWRRIDVEQKLLGAIERLVQDAPASDLAKRLSAVSKAFRKNRKRPLQAADGRHTVDGAGASSYRDEPSAVSAQTSGAQEVGLMARSSEPGDAPGPEARIVQLLLPNLRFVRDSLETILALPNPASVLETLRELATSPRTARGERFAGTEWMELRAPTVEGRQVGRIYYHGGRAKLVLVSRKREQKHDMDWFQKRPNWTKYLIEAMS